MPEIGQLNDHQIYVHPVYIICIPSHIFNIINKHHIAMANGMAVVCVGEKAAKNSFYD